MQDEKPLSVMKELPAPFCDMELKLFLQNVLEFLKMRSITFETDAAPLENCY